MGQEPILFDNSVFEYVSDSLFEGYARSNELQKGTPWLTWKGGKIPYATWREVVSFFKWSQKEHKAETQVRLYYNDERKEWRAWAHAQEPCGMTTKELPEHANRIRDNALFVGFDPAGTVHHHCDCAAFQSGTDSSDELAQNGIHITCGKITDKVIDIHVRVSYRKTFYEASLCEWFQMPAFVEPLPGELKEIAAKYVLTHIKEGEFPKLWKENVIKKVYAYEQGGHWDTASRSWVNDTTTPRNGAWDGVDENDQDDWAVKKLLKSEIESCLSIYHMPEAEALSVLALDQKELMTQEIDVQGFHCEIEQICETYQITMGEAKKIIGQLLTEANMICD